jgi:murein tripeptide amidase MpaA
LRSLGATPEGREIWMLEVTDLAGSGADDKPVFFVHGNIHAKELAGTTTSLQLIHSLLTGEGQDVDVASLLEEVAFCVVPRLNPDGAEFALVTGGEIRSRLEESRLPNC